MSELNDDMWEQIELNNYGKGKLVHIVNEQAELRMNEEYTLFEEWFETFDRDGGELMLYNTIDLEAAYLAGATAMREKCAEMTEKFTLGRYRENEYEFDLMTE